MSMESMGVEVGRMASGSNIMEKRGIGSNTRPRQCKGSDSEMGTHHVFDERPSSQGGFDLNADRVLSVSVRHMLYLVTLKVLHQVFDPYGVVEKIVTAYKPRDCQVFVQYKADQQAAHALGTLHGRCIFDGCCHLDIQCMQESEWQMYSVACGTSSDPSYVMNKIKEIPKFDDTNLSGWLEDCEAFFEILKLHPVLWITAAERSMIGDTILWSQAFSTRYGLVSWEDFRAALCEEFGQFTNQRLVEHVEKNPDEKPQVQKEVQNGNDGELVHVYPAQVQDSVHAPRVFDKMQLESNVLRNKCKPLGPLSSWKEESIMGLQQQDSSTTKVHDKMPHKAKVMEGKTNQPSLCLEGDDIAVLLPVAILESVPLCCSLLSEVKPGCIHGYEFVDLGRSTGVQLVFEEVVPWSRSSFSPGNVGTTDVRLVFMNLTTWRLGGFSLGTTLLGPRISYCLQVIRMDGATLLGPRISYCLQVIRMDLLLFSMSAIPWDPGVFRFACLMDDHVRNLIPKASEEQPGYPYELQKPFSVVIIDPEQWKWISCKAVLVLLAKALIDPKECYLLNSDSDVAFDMFNEMPTNTDGFSIFITSKGVMGLQQPSLYLMQQLRAPTLSTTLRYDMVENLKDAVGQAGGSCVVVKSNIAELIPMIINCLGLMKTPEHVCQRGGVFECLDSAYDVTYHLLHYIPFLCTVGGSLPYIQNTITDVGLPLKEMLMLQFYVVTKLLLITLLFLLCWKHQNELQVLFGNKSRLARCEQARDGDQYYIAPTESLFALCEQAREKAVLLVINDRIINKWNINNELLREAGYIWVYFCGQSVTKTSMQTPYGLAIEGMNPYVSAHYSGGDTHQINVPKSRLVGDGKFSFGVKVQPPWGPGGGLGTS